MEDQARSLDWAGKDGDSLPAEQGTNHLLVVGVDKYADHPDIPELHNAIRDAQDIAGVLVKDFGFELPESRALYGENATRRNIRKALKDLNAGENDNVILYFAGHGYYSQHLNRGFFVPYDGEFGEEEDSFLKHSDIRDYITALKAKHIFLLMDSCFSGDLFTPRTIEPKKANEERAIHTRSKYASRLCLTSGQFNQEVSDGYRGNNSPFARAVLDYLEKEDIIFSKNLIAHAINIVPLNTYKQLPAGGPLLQTNTGDGEMILRRAHRDSDLLARIRTADWSGKAALVAQFKDAFPKSEYRREVLQIGIQADEYHIWRNVNRQSENAIELFLEDHPESSFAPEARMLRDELIAKRKEKAVSAVLQNAEREAHKSKEREVEEAYLQQVEHKHREREAAEAEQELKRSKVESEAEFVLKAAEAIHRREIEVKAEQAEAARKKAEEDRRKPFVETINGVSFTMRFIPGGTYQMGDVMGDNEYDNETVHPATVADFYLAETVVTQELYEAVMGQNPSGFKGKDLPVEGVSWNDAQVFIQKLNKLTTPSRTSGAAQYRLPTEAEWEYAAREGGATVRFGNGKDVADPAEMNFDASEEEKKPYTVSGEYRQTTTPVKTFKPNGLGLYDMSGNVWEWCQDWYAAYPNSSEAGYAGPETGSSRVLRGGSWVGSAQGCRPVGRGYCRPDSRDFIIGLRLACGSPSV